ncbi:hypothetical protein ACLOJK_013370 [Asimina triloba]
MRKPAFLKDFGTYRLRVRFYLYLLLLLGSSACVRASFLAALRVTRSKRWEGGETRKSSAAVAKLLDTLLRQIAAAT